MNRDDDNDRVPMPTGVRSCSWAGLPRSAPPPASGPTPAGGRPLKIVLHVSDADGWPPSAVERAQPLAEVSGRESARRRGRRRVYGYQGSNDLVSAMAATAKSGVEYQACNNALDEKKIPVASLAPFVKVVPAGVIALAESQAEGYAYVKP